MDALLRASSLLNSGQSERPIYSMGMSPLLLPFQLLLLMFAGWVNRHQLDVIEYPVRNGPLSAPQPLL